jgi:hypothetical protein
MESSILRAAFGYLFLVLIVRVVGRRPGKQLTPFEFVLIFYLGGLTLTGMVGNEASLTNAICQILTVALCHYVLSSLRFRSDRLMRLLDGVPLILLKERGWRTDLPSHLDRFVAQKLNDHERPKSFRFGAVLPRNAMGKLEDWA